MEEPTDRTEAAMQWLGERCRSLRDGEGLSEFCHRAGIEERRYAAIEKGTAEATLGDIGLIAAAHGITPSRLFDGI